MEMDIYIITYGGLAGTDLREYVQSKLLNPLKLSSKYYLSFQISFADNSEFASDGIGALLSVDSVNNGDYQIIDSLPQIKVPDGVAITDKINWTLVDGCFTAKGGESFLTIGNFKYDNQLTLQSLGGGSTVGGYYIDDVQLHEIPAFKSDSNHFICAGVIDSTFLNLSDTSEVTTYSWSPTNGLANPTSPQTWAKPTITTTYTLSQYTPCDTSNIQVTVYVGPNACDSIVSVETLNFPLSNFKLYPNPNKGEFSVVSELYNNAVLEIFNTLGELVYQIKLTKRTSNINISNQTKGLYFIKIKSNNKVLWQQIIKQ